ncbi:MULTISPECIES: potassium-transporting ATPase subunit KdpA [Geobacillus]|uniref:Potassium-transporting ATPase potassium-binding subunit n=4 Tax=Geobacillus TaxID=129337 RepID=KDPA_GEOKA|nr:MULTISPECIES: potassium-transporting ATPase subunit KdpA [Geobacillus]Q5KUV3.1 RecName: Full=Potassium-transporting ATPase potassium-binding subunit; AltName: Full=ATP phosphohydrolase [potassium-transporting] A chain; AltName: Full=Potassium-binding and translocating subunit A; AltName: Full=Potassium-translocating ATPase A chain [Geobacillus kaustophilus HTA426]AKU26521.1 potassium ABC transporter ATPase [Geobacillus sp. LC300]ASS87190.1 potassium-transporting ATPase subunit KdpA [Geobacill
MWHVFSQYTLIFLLLIVIAVPLGKYLYVAFFEKGKIDRFFSPIEAVIYRLSGIRSLEEMTWKSYCTALLIVNAALLGISYGLLRIQHYLPLNGAKVENMEPTLTFNTVVSFMTNTNLQHYSGESGLSILSQMLFVTMMMFTSAATGLTVATALIRALSKKGKTIGNFYQDFVRANVRVLLPLSVIVTILLVAFGVPQTFLARMAVSTLEGGTQTLALGPVASLESIKHLGTNGGGFFGANSSHPFENPHPFTNVIEMLSMWCIPAALPFTYGHAVKNRKQGWVLFATMFVLFVMMLGVVYNAEQSGNPLVGKSGFAADQGNMEGKEVRFGIPLSSLFTAITTAATTGSVNNMHDSLTPIGGLVPLALMMLNNVFGGDGVGFVNIMMYAMIAVFLSGLMVGRTPEFLGRKIEPKEMKLIVIALLLHPLIILAPSAIALMTHMGTEAISNPGFHGISQVVYEYTSSAANNGSGFEGLKDNTAFWNISTGVVMLLGRYVSIIAMLAVAGSLVGKQPVPETIGTFRTDTATFGVILFGTVFIIGALTFFPVLILGPVAEYLTIR